jgi:hypothetical protein
MALTRTAARGAGVVQNSYPRGDNVDKSENYRARLEQAKRFVEVVNKYGGKAEILMLRDAGLAGNTHIPFADMNNVAVADLLSKFLEAEDLSARRK